MQTALAGLAALAVAMGIGRFAFTPVLPLMQDDFGLGVAEGGWLASANYLGYFLGAVTAARIPDKQGMRLGLAAIAATTLAMAFTESLYPWLALRAVAGLASAWVLVCVSALARDHVGVVYAGVGFGIVVAGLVCIPLDSSAAAWCTLGALATAGLRVKTDA